MIVTDISEAQTISRGKVSKEETSLCLFHIYGKVQEIHILFTVLIQVAV